MDAAHRFVFDSISFSRTIFHVDMDAFFVSVEELHDPSLKGKAVVVGGQRNERGVVSAASYEARKFGVHSAMPLRTAAKQCPQAIFVDGHPARYLECSEEVYKVLGTFTPQHGGPHDVGADETNWLGRKTAARQIDQGVAAPLVVTIESKAGKNLPADDTRADAVSTPAHTIDDVLAATQVTN